MLLHKSIFVLLISSNKILNKSVLLLTQTTKQVTATYKSPANAFQKCLALSLLFYLYFGFNLCEPCLLRTQRHLRGFCRKGFFFFAIKKIQEYKFDISDYLDILAVWYRDVLLFKATNDVNHLIFKDKI